MSQVGRPSQYGLEQHGIRHAANVFWNLPTPALYEHAVRRQEGLVIHLGPLLVTTPAVPPTTSSSCANPPASSRCGGGR